VAAADAQAVEVERGMDGAEGSRGRAVAVRKSRRWDVVEDPAVLVPDDEEHRGSPHFGSPHFVVGTERRIDVPDELITRQHVVIRMLVGGDRAIRVIGVGRLYERVVGQSAPAAVGDEIPVQAEILRSEERHPERAALARVVDLAALARGGQPTVDSASAVEPDETGIDLAERRAEVGELAIGRGGTGNRREPLVADEVVPGEGAESRKLFRAEAAHDVGGIAAGPLVARHEAGHRGDSRRGGGELLVHVLELVRRIDDELALVAAPSVTGKRVPSALSLK
jgi:hypothetical protein